MAIDPISAIVIPPETLLLAGTEPAAPSPNFQVRLRLAAGFARTAFMVFLASLAILVLLPAVIAAQAAAN